MTVGPLYISIHIYIIQVNDQKKVAVSDATLSLRRVIAFVACEKLAANQRVSRRDNHDDWPRSATNFSIKFDTLRG